MRMAFTLLVAASIGGVIGTGLAIFVIGVLKAVMQ